MCAMAHLDVSAMTHSYVCAMTHSDVCAVSYPYVCAMTHVCVSAMTHVCVCRDSFVCVCRVVSVCVCLDSHACVSCFPMNLEIIWYLYKRICVYKYISLDLNVTFVTFWGLVFVRVSRLVRVSRFLAHPVCAP